MCMIIRNIFPIFLESVTIDELMEEEGFSAVFIGSGAGLPKFMGIPGVIPEKSLIRNMIPCMNRISPTTVVMWLVKQGLNR